MAVWLCPDCGTVAIRTGLTQVEIDYVDAVQIFPQIARGLIEIYLAGGPKEIHFRQHEEPEDLGDEEGEDDAGRDQLHGAGDDQR